MDQSSRNAYEQLIESTRAVSLLRSTSALLHWDQQTMMPKGGLAYRSKQLTQIETLAHQKFTDPKIGEWIERCEQTPELLADPLDPKAVNLREWRRLYDRATRLPKTLVEQMSQTASLGRGAWGEARRESNFSHFQPWIEKWVDLLRQQAQCLGWPTGGEPWDALAEEYEPGCTAQQIESVFAPLKDRLVNLVGKLTGCSKQPEDRFGSIELPIDQQRRFVKFIAEQIGFDFDRGRLDEALHPFCSSTHCHDVRLTTRFGSGGFPDALASTMHEAGHGIYNQSLPPQHMDTPMGGPVSLGIHESQSRLWENQVGRSRTFWTWCLPRLRHYFGTAVDELDLDSIDNALHRVHPDLIRVEADELTYNLHIMIRFDLERALLNGDLEAREIPGAWNELYAKLLQVKVPDDARGCLQDMHWSAGAMGYFPTYTLGNLYAAQFFEQAQKELPDLDNQIEQGQFDPLRTWLQRNIHSQGMRYRAADLCQQVTGRPLSAEPLLSYLERTYLPLYE